MNKCSSFGPTHSQWHSTPCRPPRWRRWCHRHRRCPASGRSWSGSPDGRSAASCLSPPGNMGYMGWGPIPEGWPGKASVWGLDPVLVVLNCTLTEILNATISRVTPLETDWQSSCIHSAMSCSSLALSSSGGRSVRMTWKAWGRSVLFERRQPPQCSPLLGGEVSFFGLPLPNNKKPPQIQLLQLQSKEITRRKEVLGEPYPMVMDIKGVTSVLSAYRYRIPLLWEKQGIRFMLT